jgi:orotate phosphoribosyltransferase
VITIVDREEDAKKNLELVNVNLIALISASELI